MNKSLFEELFKQECYLSKIKIKNTSIILNGDFCIVGTLIPSKEGI